MNNDLKKHSHGYGFIAPFCMLLLCVIWIYKTPASPNKMKVITGNIKQQTHFKDIILLHNDDTKYVIGRESSTVIQLLNSKKAAVIWVKKGEETGRKFIKQLQLDGETVIEYNYLKEITTPIIFGIIGLLLIPIVIRAKRKQKLQVGE